LAEPGSVEGNHRQIISEFPKLRTAQGIFSMKKDSLQIGFNFKAGKIINPSEVISQPLANHWIQIIGELSKVMD
jgi:hypothetical protein